MDAKIIEIDEAIKMMETIMVGLIVTMTFDLSAWLGLQDKKEYVVVEDLGLCWAGNRRGFERCYRVINDDGKMVDVFETYCKISIKKD